MSPTYRTPRAAIWLSAALAVSFTLLVPYITITAVGVIFLYLSYVMPTIASLLAHGRTWTNMGPWNVGRWYKPLAAICVLSGAGLVIIGVQPPNHIAIWIVPGFAVLLIVYWYAFKCRDFEGPPSGTVSQERYAEILATERALDEAYASRNADS